MLWREAAHQPLRMSIDTPTTPVTIAADEQLWRDLQARLGAFVGRRIGDPHAAEDVAQEVLVRLHRSLGELRIHDRLDAFAYRIARNAIIDHSRATASAKEMPAAPDDLIARIEAGGEAERGADEATGRRELARCLEP